MAADIWEKDVLGRRENAKYLTKYLTERYVARTEEEGFVLAINAEWGLGKTFMLRCWKQDLETEGYPTVYFDAWKNDFTPEPLVAFISEIDEGLTPFFKNIPLAKKYFNAAIRSMKQVLKPALKAALFGVAKHGLGLSADHVGNLISDATGENTHGAVRGIVPSIAELEKSMSEAVEAALKQHKNTKDAILAFKEKLTLLVDALKEDSTIKLPIFIFVDELDRCRPDYAVELLEGIKHLFGVPGVYFLVATNMSQLGESTKAIYGAGFDGHRYLKRFFDMEYFLPPPNLMDYSKSLFLNFPLPPVEDFYTGFYPELQFDNYDFLPYIFSIYADHFGCGLRDQFQAMKIFEAALYSVKHRKIHIHLLVYLSILYQRSPDVYEDIYSSRGIIDQAKYDKITSKSTFAYFKYQKNATHGIEYKKIAPLDVLKIYMSMIFKSSRILRDSQEINRATFPDTIVNSLVRDGDNATFNTHYVSEYFNIVRSAGGFSERIPA